MDLEGNVVSSHLRGRFSSSLNEAAADLSSYSQILTRFRFIENIINAMKQNPASMVEVLYDLMDALSECTIFARGATSNKGFNLCRVVRFENKMRSRLDKIERSLRDIGPDQHCNPSSTAAAGLVNIQQASPGDSSLITGFESQVREIEEMLMPVDSGFTPIGIVGMCGSGKTALAREVFSSCIVENTYFPRIWVGLSEKLYNNQGSDLRETILNNILRGIGHDTWDLEYSDYSVVQLLEKLRFRLTGKRYLIVLDDAWRMDEWFADLACTGRPEAESFTNGLPKESGGAVIVTSRGENVIRRMVGEKHVIRPKLRDEICWTIFTDAVRQQGKIEPDHPMMIQMERSVINSCQGLPLAANILANVISNLLADNK